LEQVVSRQVRVHAPLDLHRWLRVQAAARGLSLAVVIVELLEELRSRGEPRRVASPVTVGGVPVRLEPARGMSRAEQAKGKR
jgi:hypothetical protein